MHQNQVFSFCCPLLLPSFFLLLLLLPPMMFVFFACTSELHARADQREPHQGCARALWRARVVMGTHEGEDGGPCAARPPGGGGGEEEEKGGSQQKAGEAGWGRLGRKIVASRLSIPSAQHINPAYSKQMACCVIISWVAVS